MSEENNNSNEYDPRSLDPIEFDNPLIEVTYTYPVPDEWRSTEFTLGKTDTHFYRGPRYLTFQFDKDTGKEVGWCLITAAEIARPVPLNVVQVKVDCMAGDENALLCDIGHDQGHQESQDLRLNRTWTVLHEAADGYNHTWYTDEVEPRDIYDEFNLTLDFETGKIKIPVKGWENEGRTDITWDDIKEMRNKMLHDSDGKISDDMPQAMKDEWARYRQLLRDLPDALAHYDPWVAGKMWPTMPGYNPPAAPGNEPTAPTV